jgi:hypothetical protein
MDAIGVLYLGYMRVETHGAVSVQGIAVTAVML